MATIITEIHGVSNDTTPTSEPGEPSQWFVATTKAIHDETPTVKTFTFELPHEVDHLAGQHYEIRLTAPDGYQAARLYSAASAAHGTNTVDLTVALLPTGEVSPYLHHNLQIGDQLELRGPLGRSFIWTPEIEDPVLLVAGGSGVAPMRCILQAHQLSESMTPVTLLYSSRTYDEIIYKSELLVPDSPLLHTMITITDTWPEDWKGWTGRLDEKKIASILQSFSTPPRCFICGSTPFVEAMANLIVSLGTPPQNIRAERFGGI